MKLIKDLFLYILFLFCRIADIFLPRKFAGGVPVLAYHSVSNSSSDLTVSPGKFEEQIKYLSKKNFKTVLPNDIYHLIPKENLKIVLVTFDDGFKDNRTCALPILQKYGFVASVFISADYVGKKSFFCSEEKNKNMDMMNEEEIKGLQNNGWLVGNHFISHRPLINLNEEEIISEFKGARERIAEITANGEFAFIAAYPKNQYNDKVKRAVRRAGAEMVFAGGNKLFNFKKDDRFAIPRITVSRGVSMIKFKLILSPSFHFIKKIFRK